MNPKMKKINQFLMILFVLCFTKVSFGQLFYPGGDTCSSAVLIPPGDGYYTVDDGPGSDHWYSFIAPCDGDLTIRDVVGSSSDKRIHSGVCGSLVLLAETSWISDSVSYSVTAGEQLEIVVNDSWNNQCEFNVEFDGCSEIDSVLLDIQGIVYYDLNENGVQDLGEMGRFATPIVSDPSGVYSVSGIDGHYFRSVTDLDDGLYQIHPDLPEYWSISSDSLVYNIDVNSSFEQRDSLDFGLRPDTLIYEINAELVGSFPRCNDTISYWLNVQNTGTTIASGQIDLELDDSVHYVSASILPDSIVGRHHYWSYDNLFFYEHSSIIVQIGTPDGEDDTITNILAVTVDSADVEMFSSTEALEEVILCAFDPNDKTPTPLGEGEFGYVDPETETIEYLVRFQNTGTDTAFNVVIKDQLDENLDWYSITPLAYSHNMHYEMDSEGEVSFIFDNIMLPDSNVNEIASHGFVKYRIDLLPGLPLETSIHNTAYIYFDLNPAVITNTTINTLHLDVSRIDELLKKEKIVVYPNPFSQSTTLYFENDLQNHSVQIVDLLGNQVYFENKLSGNQLAINADRLGKGMYLLLLVDDTSNQVVSNTKLIVN